MLTTRRRLIGGICGLLFAGGMAACGTGGPGNSAHQPNSCVGRPGGSCTPTESGHGNGGTNRNGTTNSGTGNSESNNTNNSGAITR